MTSNPRKDKYVWNPDDITFDKPESDEDGEESSTDAKKALTTPDGEVVAYDSWSLYDDLSKDIGEAWLKDYQSSVLKNVLAEVDENGLSTAALDKALDVEPNDLVHRWTGTDEKPGVLSRLLMAGIAAGDASLKQGSTANPNRPVALKAVDLAINWNLASAEAVSFIERYALNLIKRLNSTTRKEIQEIITQWLHEGGTQNQLRQMIQEVVLSEVRAAAISSTESTRAYAEGARERYKQADVKKIQWRTVNVGVKRLVKRPGDVCKICSELDGKIGTLEKGFWSAVLQAWVFPPCHVGDRCWFVPADEEM